MPHRVIPTIDGHRGSFLFIGGLLYTGIGLAYTTSGDSSSSFDWLPHWLGSDTLGWLWIVGGASAVVVGLASKRHSTWEAPAFAALVLPATFWALVSAVAWVLALIPGGQEGNDRAFVSVLMFGLLAAWVGVVAGWEEPVPPVEAEDE